MGYELDLLHPKVRELAKSRFKKLTSIQSLAIPRILKGESLLLIAGTGFGKTEAAMLPLFSKLLEEKPKPIALLYITPLRALNRDLFSRLFWWGDRLNLSIAIRHGDTPEIERKEQRETPPLILITTPESLQIILAGKVMRKHLANVRYVVIDEVHELLGSKRGVSLLFALARLRLLTRKKFQTIALSATIGNPQDFAKALGVKVVKSLEERELEATVLVKGDIDTLVELINRAKSSIVFTNTRDQAEWLTKKLKERLNKVEVDHRFIEKSYGKLVESKLRESALQCVVATSSLELGIDIGEVEVVIQYSSPRQVVKLLQRAGRSLHRGMKKQRVVILASESELHECAAIVELALERKLERTEIPSLSLDILAHQIVGLCLNRDFVNLEAIYELARSVYPFRKLRKKELIEVVDFLCDLGLIKRCGNLIRRRRRAWEYYYENASTIPESKFISMKDIASGKLIAKLDSNFVSEYCSPGATFVCAGVTWRVVSVEEACVHVERCEHDFYAIPYWSGELIPVSKEVAARAAELLARKEIESLEFLSEHARKVLLEIKRVQGNFFRPSTSSIVIEKWRGNTILHAFFGQRVNETLAYYLVSKLKAISGVSPRIKVTPYAIVVSTSLEKNFLKELLCASSKTAFIAIVLEFLVNTPLFKKVFQQVAVRFGILKRSSDVSLELLGKLVKTYENSPVYKETLNEISQRKLDLDGAYEVIKKIANNEIRLEETKALSPLGKIALEYGKPIARELESSEVSLEDFKRRIENRLAKLVCANCKRVICKRFVGEIREADLARSCKCGSRLIAALFGEENLPKSKLIENAELIKEYGRLALLALATPGVGLKTAKRLLARFPRDEKSLLSRLYEAWRVYLRTRKFWKLEE